jgi:hypothetical protein
MLIVSSACTSSAGSDSSTPSAGVTSGRIQVHGPLDWESMTATQVGLAARPGQVSEDGEIVLVNRSSHPITLTRVFVAPQPGVAPIGYFGAYIVGPQRSVGMGMDQRWGAPRRPVNGYEVRPTRGQADAPLLVLKIGPGARPRTYNNNIQVFYQDAEGNRYVAPYPLRYLVCNTAEAEPRCVHRPLPG